MLDYLRIIKSMLGDIKRSFKEKNVPINGDIIINIIIQ